MKSFRLWFRRNDPHTTVGVPKFIDIWVAVSELCPTVEYPSERLLSKRFANVPVPVDASIIVVVLYRFSFQNSILLMRRISRSDRAGTTPRRSCPRTQRTPPC